MRTVFFGLDWLSDRTKTLNKVTIRNKICYTIKENQYLCGCQCILNTTVVVSMLLTYLTSAQYYTMSTLTYTFSSNGMNEVSRTDSPGTSITTYKGAYS